MTILIGGVSGSGVVTLTGDVTGVGVGTIATSLSDSGVVPGTYGSNILTPVITVDRKGRIVSITTQPTAGGGGGGSETPTAGVSSFNTRTGAVQLTSSDITTALGSSPLPLSSGGTGATNTTAAINNLLPQQLGNSGKVLSTDGTNIGWVLLSGTGGTGNGVSAGSESIGYITYNGVTQAAGQWDGGAALPLTGQRLNYNGILCASELTASNGDYGLISLFGGTAAIPKGGAIQSRTLDNNQYAYLSMSGSVIGLATERTPGQPSEELMRLQGKAVTINGGNLSVGDFVSVNGTNIPIGIIRASGFGSFESYANGEYYGTTLAGNKIDLATTRNNNLTEVVPLLSLVDKSVVVDGSITINDGLLVGPAGQKTLGTSGQVLSSTGVGLQWITLSGGSGGGTGLTAGDTGIGYLTYAGTTSTAGQFDGGTTSPSATTRLNYNGKFYSSNLALTGTGVGGANAPTLRFTQDSGGTLMARNAADTAYAYLTVSGTNVDIAVNDVATLRVLPNSIEMKAETSFENNINLTATSKLVINSVVPTSGQVLTATATGMQWQTPASGGGTGTGLTAGSTSTGYVNYAGTTSTAGQFDGGTTSPSATTRLNYNGKFYSSNLALTGTGVGGINTPTVRLTHDNGGTLMARNAADTAYAYLTVGGTNVDLAVNDVATLRVLPNSIEMKAVTSFESNINLTATSKLVINSVVPTNGQVLTATATGMQWQTPASGGGTGTGLTAGSTSTGYVNYAGTTSTAGQFDGGTTSPSATTRLNYNGVLYTTGSYASYHRSSDAVEVLNDNTGTVAALNTARTGYRPLAINGSKVTIFGHSTTNLTSADQIMDLSSTVVFINKPVNLQSTIIATDSTGVGESTGTSGQVLSSTGTGRVKWINLPNGGSGTVTSVAAGTGMNFSTITTSGSISLGTPSTVSLSTSNSVSGTTHTHAVTIPDAALSTRGLLSDGTGVQFISGSKSFQTSYIEVKQASAGTESQIAVGHSGMYIFGDDTKIGFYNSNPVSSAYLLKSTGKFVADVVPPSDQRIKTDVVKITDALSKVQSINGYTYSKNGNPVREMGVIAQEVEAVAPELVSVVYDDIKGVAYSNMTALLIEAVKELTSKVEALESRISALEAK